MGSSRPQRPSPAFVLAAISLFISLTGGAYAVSLGRGVVTTRAIKNGAVKEAKIADGAVTTPKLGDQAVTTAKLGAGAVTGSQLAGNSVTGSKVLDGSLTGSDLGLGAITGQNIATGTITGGNILNGSIGNADLGSSSVDTPQLASGAVAPANVGTIPTVRARNTSLQTIPGTGVLTPISLNSETWDTANMHSTSGNTTRLIAPIAGTYLITANVFWVCDTAGTRELAILIDTFTDLAKPIADVDDAAADTCHAAMSVTTVYQLGPGEFVRAAVAQDTGLSKSLGASSPPTETGPEVSMTWLGPVS
jgi:hypothetical protein